MSSPQPSAGCSAWPSLPLLGPGLFCAGAAHAGARGAAAAHGWACGAWVLGLGAMLLLATLGYWAQSRQRRVAAAQASLNRELVVRERLALELHDTLLQGMHGLTLRFQAVAQRMAADDALRAPMDAALQRADQLMNEGRDRVLAMQQQGGLHSALAEALGRTGRELAGEHTAAFSLQIEGPARELAAAVHEGARQILGEALLNAFRHAQAQQIIVTLHYGRRGFRASVVDDGIGIPPALLQHGRPGHWGLSGMRERAECIGAELALRPRRGGGTELVLRLAARLAYRPP